jgi:hypothetical protein
MKDILNSFLNPFCYAIASLFFLIPKSHSQSISKPTFVFTSACASSGFKDYTVNFSFSPVTSFASGNTFYLQLSDASGNFSSFTEVANSSTITTSPGALVFSVPSNFVGGEGFKFRIRSTSPALLSPESNAVSIYFQVFTTNFFINNQLPTARFCEGSSLTLSIDNPTAPPTSLTNLKYRWFRNNVEIAGQTTASLAVSTIGRYYVEINYGSCTTVGSLSRSQEVNVTSAPAVPQIIITSSIGTEVSIGNPTTLSTTQNSSFAYQWYRDGQLIPGAINFNYITEQEGSYYVVVNNGICSVQSNTITLTIVIKSAASVIPNLISPNGDGINETWVIPQEYINGSDTEIIITNTIGDVVLKTKTYSNDWPNYSIDFKSANPIFYYTITKANGEVKKGIITVIK